MERIASLRNPQGPGPQIPPFNWTPGTHGTCAWLQRTLSPQGRYYSVFIYGRGPFSPPSCQIIPLLPHPGIVKLRYRSFNPSVTKLRLQPYDAPQILLPPFREEIEISPRSWVYSPKPRSYPLPTPAQEGYTTRSTRPAGRPSTVASSEIAGPELSRLQRAPRDARRGGKQ